MEAQCSHLPVSQLAEVGRVGRTSADVVDPETTAGWAGRSMPASGGACSAATPVRPHDSDVRKRQATRARRTISTSPTECRSATAPRAMRLPTPEVPHRAGRLFLVRIPRAQPWPRRCSRFTSAASVIRASRYAGGDCEDVAATLPPHAKPQVRWPERDMPPTRPVAQSETCQATHPNHKTAGQTPFTAGSRIATHSTCAVIGKVSAWASHGKAQVRCTFTAHRFV